MRGEGVRRPSDYGEAAGNLATFLSIHCLFINWVKEEATRHLFYLFDLLKKENYRCMKSGKKTETLDMAF